ncbi:growth-regulating factor 1-like [Pistacia vera]|uniref:growth-regulating factor 1-like n=1 Tax=Pistacia vera TaxID=55513 RepID=UPI00126376F6|nr:growth-regulating factor 1-like [Pistacia vera]
MDFGMVGFDGLMGSDTTSGFTSLVSDPVNKHKWYGSTGFLKQERSGTEDEWRSSKVAKSDDFSVSKEMVLQQRNNSLLRSNTTLFDGQQQQQMLSFSSPKSDSLSLDRTSENATLPYYQLASSAYSRNTGYNCGSFNVANIHGVLAGARGPFTPSQWMELEHQALIYKYITANVPIPSNLLFPIRKALDSAGFSSLSAGFLRSNTLAWGTFHLGFSNNTDPEPGRCRRTDGKKWRCSRDAVADQKYCERHMNRGRHRSRKPVEGQSGHSAAATTTSNSSKLIPITTSVVMGSTGGDGASSSLAIEHQQQLKTLQPGGSSNLSAAAPMNRVYLNKDTVDERKQDTPGLSMLSPTIDLKFKENSFLMSKQQIPFEESSRSEFGFVSSDSLLNPSHRSPLMTCRNFGSSQDLTDQETETQHSLRQFMDEWPKNQSNRSAISWPEIDMQSDRTQLSISIPVASSDFMSSTSSPNNDKVTLSPLRLSREFDPIQMGLGVGSVLNEPSQRQANWIPITWESSMGGPLGEVLHNTNNNNTTINCKNPAALNLMSEDWDNSPRLSPTGVLQKTAFGSLSNSSAGSSPRAENNKTREGASLCNDLLG